MKLLFDADIIIYRACTVAEQEVNWGDDFWTLSSDLKDAKRYFIKSYDTIMKNLQVHTGKIKNPEIIMSLTDVKNFRKIILPSYKANRKDTRKPLAYRALVQWVKDNYNTMVTPMLESDDQLGLISTEYPDDSIIISLDKDMNTLAATYYNFGKDTFVKQSQEDADYFWYVQCMKGDTCDGFSGLKGVGEVIAKKLLDKNGSTFETVINAFESKGFTVDDAIQQARMARILRHRDYNWKTGDITLFTPSGYDDKKLIINTNNPIDTPSNN